MTTIKHEPVQSPNNFLVYYRGLLAIAAVGLFFTKLDTYLESNNIGIPLYWLIALTVAAIPLFVVAFKEPKSLPTPIIVWCGLYLALSSISVVLQPEIPPLQLLEDQIRSVLFLLIMSIVLSRDYVVLKWVKSAILLITLLNPCMLIYEFFEPSAFYLLQHSPGRASGFYHDSNAASCGVIVGMILSIDLVKPKYRLFYALFALLGVVATFSRGGMLGWFVTVFLFAILKIIPRYQIPLLFLAVFVSTTILSSQLNNLSYLKNADGTDLFREDTLARIEFIVDPFGQEDASGDSRLTYAEDAFRKFSRKPFLGNGLGSGANSNYTSSRGTAQRSHNIYIDQIVEYGFLGLFVYPLLLVASVWKAQGKVKQYAIPFMLFLLLWGIFSHTTMNSFFSLITYAIMANFTQQSRLGNFANT